MSAKEKKLNQENNPQSVMTQISIRKPFVSGQFYPSSAKELNSIISSYADKSAQKEDAIGCILPHAGYVYSGRVAVETVSKIKIKDTVVLLGPNHTGLGANFSIMTQGTWQTPLGNIEINTELANLFLNKSKLLKSDTLAHLNEHSLEVELPILQYFRNDFSATNRGGPAKQCGWKIVPITIKSDDLSMLEEVAQSLAGIINENKLKSSTTFIASSDMTHYEPQKSAQKKDALAIEAICALDEQKLEIVVKKSEISMCGFAPVAVLIKAAKLLGAKEAKLIKYQTSGDTTGDRSSVVGYAGITIY